MQATIWRRLLATAIDFVVVPAAAMLVMLVTGVIEHAQAWADGFPWVRVFFLGVAGYLIVNGVLLWRFGQTLGKRLLKIRIVDHTSNEKPPLWKLIVIRTAFFPFLHATFIGYWYLLVADLGFGMRADRRCLHDLVCGTKVVTTNNAKVTEQL
jgi:uncharacterized RDD family membrane protein YckC